MVKIPKIKTDQSIKKRLQEKHGKENGKKIAECMESCMDKDGAEFKECMRRCLEDKLSAEEAAKIDVDSIYSLMGYWVVVG